MLNASTLRVGDRIRQQVTNEEGIVEAIHLDANGRIERVTVAVNMAHEGMKSGYPSMWDRIEPDPLPWGDDNPGQVALAEMAELIRAAQEALSD